MDELPTPQHIKDAASAAGISIAELCRRAGTDDSTFWRWQAGEHSPRLSIVQRWMSVLGALEREA